MALTQYCALFLFLVFGVGCDGNRVNANEGQTSPQFVGEKTVASISVVDNTGRQISLKSPAQRIVSLSPGFTETLFRIGCGDRVIVRDRWSDFPVEATRLPATDSVNPSVEAIAGYDPDLVLLYFNDARHVSAFSKVGIETALFDPQTFSEVATDIVKIGQLCGEEERAKSLASQMKKRRKRIRSLATRFAPVRVYVEIDGTDPTRPWTTGQGSFLDELLQLAGATNVFHQLHKPYVQVSLEEVIRANPDVILMAGTEDGQIQNTQFLLDRPGFSSVAAVQNNRIIYSIDKNIISRPSARLADGLEQLFTALHSKENQR